MKLLVPIGVFFFCVCVRTVVPGTRLPSHRQPEYFIFLIMCLPEAHVASFTPQLIQGHIHHPYLPRACSGRYFHILALCSSAWTGMSISHAIHLPNITSMLLLGGMSICLRKYRSSL